MDDKLITGCVKKASLCTNSVEESETVYTKKEVPLRTYIPPDITKVYIKDVIPSTDTETDYDKQCETHPEAMHIEDSSCSPYQQERSDFTNSNNWK